MPTRIAICLFENDISSFDIASLMGGQPLSKIDLQKTDPYVVVYLKKSADSTPELVDIVAFPFFFLISRLTQSCNVIQNQLAT